MPTISLADGQSFGIVDISYEDLSAFVFENGTTPTNCDKGSGNPPVWVEFGPEVAPNLSASVRVKQANIVAVFE